MKKKKINLKYIFCNIFISEFAGGDPEPLENVRVLPVNNKVEDKGLQKQRHLQKQRKKPDFKLWEEGPNFDTEQPQDVVAREGKMAFLKCRIFDRGNKTVSFIMGITTNSC